MPDQKSRLLASDPFSGDLFDSQLLSNVIAERQGDVVSSAHVKLAQSLDMVLPNLVPKHKRKAPHQSLSSQGMAQMGSPLADTAAPASAASAPTLAGRKFVRGGRGRGGRGRGGNPPKVNPKMSGNPTRGFQA